jgi:hypothetical protein
MLLSYLRYSIALGKYQVGHYNSFLIRIWAGQEDSIRGYVQHVGTQEGIYFTDWEKMTGFISNHLSWHINQDSNDEGGQLLLHKWGEQSQ